MSNQEITNQEIINDEVINVDDNVIADTEIKNEIPSDMDDKKMDDKRPIFKGKKRGGAMKGRGPRAPREKPEFEQKAIDVSRVTRVTSGGRRFSLRISMVIGDRNGRVGLGTGKGLDTQLAMEKAFKDARKNLIKLPIDDKKSIPYEIESKYDSAKIWIMPNNSKGLIAGSSARTILSLAGLQNVTAKFHGGTKNKLNNARVTMKALSKLAIKSK